MGKTKGVLKRYCVNLLGREELERKTFSWQFALSSAYPTLPSNPQRTHVVIWNGYCSVSKVRVMVNFMLIWMGHRMPRYFVKCFWVCLGGCFWTRLESELVDWVKQSILPNLGGHHLIRWGTDENKRSRGRENLPSGWWTGNIGLLLPLNWDLHQQLLWSWGLGVTLRSTPSDLGVSMLQMAGCGASQPPQSFKSIPYGMSPFCVSGELWLILCVNRKVSCKQWKIWLLSLEYINLIWWNIKKVWRS